MFHQIVTTRMGFRINNGHALKFASARIAIRASDLLPTQREAIERAKELEPNHSTPIVERVHNRNELRSDGDAPVIVIMVARPYASGNEAQQ